MYKIISDLGWKSLTFILALLCTSIVIAVYLIVKTNFGAFIPIGLMLVFIVWKFWGEFGFLCFFVVNPLFWPGAVSAKIPFVGQIVPDLPIQQTFLILFGVGYFIYFILQTRKKELQIMPRAALVLILFSGLMVSMFFAMYPDISELYSYIRIILYGVSIYALVYFMVDTTKKAHIIIKLLIITGILFSLVLSIPAVKESYIPDSNNLADLGGTWRLPFVGFRFWLNSGMIAPCLAITISLAWAKILVAKNVIKKLVWIGFSVIMLVTLVTTVSRTGIYGVVIGVALIMIIYSFSPQKRIYKPFRLLIRSGTAVIMFLLFIYLGSVVLNNFVKSSDVATQDFIQNKLTVPPLSRDASAQTRISLYRDSLDLSSRYLLGAGFNALPRNYGLNHHSLYTMMLAGLGVIGFPLYVFLIIWSLVRCVKGGYFGDAEIFNLSMYTFSGVVLFLIMGFGFPIIEAIWGTTLFWVLLALAAKIPELVKTEPRVTKTLATERVNEMRR